MKWSQEIWNDSAMHMQQRYQVIRHARSRLSLCWNPGKAGHTPFISKPTNSYFIKPCYTVAKSFHVSALSKVGLGCDSLWRRERSFAIVSSLENYVTVFPESACSYNWTTCAPKRRQVIGITRQWESSTLGCEHLIGQRVQGVLAKTVYKGIGEPVEFTLRWVTRRTNCWSFFSESHPTHPSQVKWLTQLS